ncbi:polysaccharide deacetylase family protein [Actinoplanes sp. HUAS TT8]|uniref:polysaccharide deacetylase family protein n=1 Tax=Actinoplanes sp. HUAS TT8 TaxID=3447453 RepID=UPI003F51F67C
MNRSKLSRLVAAGALLALVAGCNDSAGPAASATTAPAAGSTTVAATPSASASGGTGVAGVPVNGTQTPESVSAALAALPADIRARIPQFPAAPAPFKVELPAGDKAVNFQRIPTTHRVAFITIDDGWTKDPMAMKLFQAANVPITLFLEVDAVKVNPAYFTELQSTGAVIENHTLTHPNLTHLSYEGQKHQICGAADELGKLYGRRPVLFRPPGGAFNGNTLRAVKECGMKASFTWRETTDKGIIRFQDGRRHIASGDIILMHFRPAFVEDFLAVLNVIKKDNMTPALLDDYIP